MTEAASLSAVSYLDTPESLTRFCSHIDEAQRVAVDIEADSLHHYFEKVCLIQISVGEHHGIVDPLAIGDLSPLCAALAERSLVFHGGDYDLRMLGTCHGFEPHGEVFDTMLAAQLLGFEELGLAALVKRYFSIELPKDGQKSDWSRRPLPADLLEYAINDTRYLEALAERLTEELERLGRLEWHREACLRMIETAANPVERNEDREWRFKGVSKLKGRQLAMAKELWYWRDEQARQADRPPFMIFGNQAIIALVEWVDAHSEANLEDGPKLPRNCHGKRLKALKEALAAGLALPKSLWPLRQPHSAPPTSPVRPSESAVEALREARDSIAQRLELPAPVLAPKATLLDIAAHRPATIEGLMACSRMLQWQADLLAEEFLRVLKEDDAAPEAKPRRKNR